MKDVAKADIKEDDYPLVIMSNAPGYPSGPVFDEYTVTSRMIRTVYLETKVSKALKFRNRSINNCIQSSAKCAILIS